MVFLFHTNTAPLLPVDVGMTGDWVCERVPTGSGRVGDDCTAVSVTIVDAGVLVVKVLVAVELVVVIV